MKSLGFHSVSGMPISEEYRAFYLNNHLLIISGYWKIGTLETLNDTDLEYMKSIAKRIKSNFVSVDFARAESGKLIIMEIGDGQVSGLQEISADKFYYIAAKLWNLVY